MTIIKELELKAARFNLTVLAVKGPVGKYVVKIYNNYDVLAKGNAKAMYAWLNAYSLGHEHARNPL